VIMPADKNTITLASSTLRFVPSMKSSLPF
jgi:hypothetical protein